VTEVDAGAQRARSPHLRLTRLTRLTQHRDVSDSLEYLVDGFRDGLKDLSPDVVEQLSAAKAHDIGRRAARAAIAPLMWSMRLGETLNTSRVTEHLSLSRQALAKRLAAGTILGLPGRGTTLYPVWQFTSALDEVRPEVRTVLKIFAETGRPDAYAVVSWMAAGSDDLDGMSPLDWIHKGMDPQTLSDAARRAAGRLAAGTQSGKPR
jgi:hypothetical protein